MSDGLAPDMFEVCDRDLSDALLERYLGAEAIAVDTETTALDEMKAEKQIHQLACQNLQQKRSASLEEFKHFVIKSLLFAKKSKRLPIS